MVSLSNPPPRSATLRTMLFLLALLASPAFAHHDSEHPVLATSSDLREWCQRESEARLVGDKKTPANWTARHYEKGNTLIVEGRWRVDGEDVRVECRAGRGAREEFASVEFVAG